MFKQIEKLIARNYYLNLSAKEAYKSYVRAYDSHSLKHIFDINKLDLVSVAKSFGFENPPFVDLRKHHLVILSFSTVFFLFLAVSNCKGGRQEIKNRRRPNDGSNYAQGGLRKKQVDKSVIYRAVPLKKDNRSFTR